MRDTCTCLDIILKEKHYLSDLRQVCLLLRRQRFIYLNAVIEINECFFRSFHERQLKALEQFEAKEYSSFQQVAHV